MSLAGEALNGIGLWMTRRERKQARDDAAVRSVLTALNATKRYIARRDRGEQVDRGAEAELVELWTTASVHPSPDLLPLPLSVNICWIKCSNCSPQPN